MLDGAPYEPPSVSERLALALEHARDLVREKGERVGIPESRKHMGWYTHGVRNSAAARVRLMAASSLDEIAQILSELEQAESLS